jgi:hypothetical protein
MLMADLVIMMVNVVIILVLQDHVLMRLLMVENAQKMINAHLEIAIILMHQKQVFAQLVLM